MGLPIANCQLPISDWRLAIKAIGNWQSEIGNLETHPLPRCGTDLISRELRLPGSIIGRRVKLDQYRSQQSLENLLGYDSGGD